MTMTNRIITMATAALSVLTLSAKPAPSILTIKDSIHDVTVMVPESFETDVKKMQENWYLQTYADLDRNADQRQSVVTTDREYIERLGQLPTVIEMPFNSVVRDFIVMYADRKKQLVENMLGMSLYYMPIFEDALERYGLPLELRYLPVIESALNPSAVSRAGAAGLWQFMPGTGTQLGLELNSLVDQRRDPYLSSDAGARYLKQLYDIFGDWSLAIAAYNCGPGNVAKAIRRANGGKDFWEIYRFLPAETRGYVPAFIAANYVMNYYDKHNISPALARKPILTDTVHVTRRIHLQQVSDVLAIPLDALRALNPQYRQDVIPGDIHPYSLTLPSLQAYAFIANLDTIANHNAALYARRDVVEPSTGSVGTDSKGRYVDELVVKYHTVRKGETITKIAKQYGVTVADIRSANKMGKKQGVKRGQKLKINTYKRRYIEDAPEQKPQDNTGVENVTVDGSELERQAESQQATTVAVDGESAQPAEPQAQAVGTPEPPKAETPKATEKKKTETKKTTQRTHTVKKGESPASIARQYGLNFPDILKANNLKETDKIQPGQKLIIPDKPATKTKSRSSKKKTRKK